VDPKDYVVPPDMMGAQIPEGNRARLTTPLTEDELDCFIKRLPPRKAAGPDGLPYELLKVAGKRMRQYILEGVNAALQGDADWPTVWKSGHIRLLHKKGPPTEAKNFRPVVLLSAIYKVLTATITSRLSALAEEYRLLDANQEGFRPCRNTHWQAQSLYWDRCDAQLHKKKLYVAYIDFANAFNSIDHEAIWAWLTAMRIPDVDLLRQVYKGSFFQADTPYGMSAPLYLGRGTKQGDGLSPLLFILVFNALMNSIRNSGCGPEHQRASVWGDSN
jgi:hypothetical protein